MPTKLVSMKIQKADRDAKTDTVPSLATDGPAYPWGLSLTLDNDALDKLDLDEDDFKVGATMMLVAKVEVTAISSNETRGSDPNKSVGLQITDLCLEDDAAKTTNAEAALYKAAK